MCQSNLDGWEEDDSAIEEHLKHAPSCGWAVAASIEQTVEDGSHNLDNPMSMAMRNARHMTFGTNWPHENKRGWKCKTQKVYMSTMPFRLALADLARWLIPAGIIVLPWKVTTL